MNIKIEKPAPERLEELKVKTWPTLEKEACTINWYFDQIEESYFLEGRIIVVTEDGQEVEVKKGDLAVFSKGLRCTWYIKKPMRKHFMFNKRSAFDSYISFC